MYDPLESLFDVSPSDIYFPTVHSFRFFLMLSSNALLRPQPQPRFFVFLTLEVILELP